MTNNRDKLIDEVINQIQFTNNTIEMLNLTEKLKKASIEKACILINRLTYAECLYLFASWEDLPNIFIIMLTHDEILTRISKCLDIPWNIRKVLYDRMETLHKIKE